MTHDNENTVEPEMTTSEIDICDLITAVTFRLLADGADPGVLIDSLRGCAAGIAELLEAGKMENSTKKTRH